MADNVAVTAGTGTSVASDDVAGVHYQRVKLTDGTADATGVIAADIGIKANALRVAPASDITDATYIGDIKFGEALPAGTAAIGKLAANSGVDIGDVDILSIAAGNNNIGDVDVASIAAGTNLIGKVSIDQATANANEVVVKNRGGISISQTPTITAGAYSAKDAVGGLLTFANAARVSGGASVLNSVTIVDNDSENAQLELWLFNADPTVAADNAAFDISDANMAKLVGVVPISTADYYALADNGAASVRGVGLQFDCAATSLYGQLKCVGTPTYTATSDLTVILAIEYLD